MGELYKLKVSIEEKIKTEGLDLVQMKGKIGLRTGRVLSLITPATPDDAVSIDKFRQAAWEFLQLKV